MSPAYARERLHQINLEIEQLENRMAVIHGLGDSSSAQGISHDFRQNEIWRKRLDYLRAARRQIERFIRGDSVSAPGLTLTDYHPD